MVIGSKFSLGHFNGSNVFTRSNSSGNSFSNSSTPFGSPAGGSPFSEKDFHGIGNQCRGSAVASYSATQELLDGKILSVSAMKAYKNKCHEELRSEDYESNKNKGFTFSTKNQGNVFQQSNLSFGACTMPGFGITSRPSSWSTSSSSGSSFSWSPPSASNLVTSTTSRFHFSTTSAFSNSTGIFGIPTSGSHGTTSIESTMSKQCQGSRVSSYSATTAVDRTNGKCSIEKFQSISAMPVYKDRSHEELRLEDYKLRDKGQLCCFKISDAPPNIFPSTPLSNQSSLNSPFQPFKSNLVAPKIGNLTAPSNKISTVPAHSPSLNPFSCTNICPSQPQGSVPQPNAVSSTPIFTPGPNPFSLTPRSDSIPASNIQCPKISTTLTAPSVGTFSWSKPSITMSPSIQTTLVTELDSWPFISDAQKHGQTVEKVDSVSTNDQSQLSQVSEGLTTVKDFNNQDRNGQQYVPSSISGVQTSLVVNPFSMESPIDQSNAALASRQRGISSLPVSNNLSSKRMPSLLRIRHVSSRHPSLPAQRPSCETKVPFFIDEIDKPGPIAPLLPRENPRDWVKNSLSFHSHSKGKYHEDNNENPTVLTDSSFQEEDLSATLNSHQEHVNTLTEKHEADVLAAMPKLPHGDYYTEPSIKELAAKEMAETGYCTHVNNFTVGRRGYGSIKFLGETNIRHLDLESVVQFNNREVIVYLHQRNKPPVGQGLNKPAEVTLLNVKCVSKKTGKQYVEGPQCYRYKEMLMKKTSEQGAEFVSYDPVQGVWKFRVQHLDFYSVFLNPTNSDQGNV